MQITFQRMTARTLRERIAEKIEEAILNGSLREGERIVERKLAAQFATSLTAVREALIELEGRGFVTKKPNSATHVTKLSSEAAEKILAVRNALEALAVEEASRRATPEQIQSLEKRYLELLDVARSKDASLFMRADLALHETIWEIAGNEYLQATLRRTIVPIFAFTAIRIVSGTPFDLVQHASSHLPILEAIKSNDPEVAKRALLIASDEWLSRIRRYVFRELINK